MDGLFEFTSFFINGWDVDQLDLGIYHNGVPACFSLAAQSSSASHHSGGCSVVVHLNAGDIVNVRCNNAGAAYGNYFSGFTGHFVHHPVLVV